MSIERYNWLSGYLSGLNASKEAHVSLLSLKPTVVDMEKSRDGDVLIMRLIDIPGLSVRVLNALKYEGITKVFELVEKTERELILLPNMGRKSASEIKQFLEYLGLRLKEVPA